MINKNDIIFFSIKNQIELQKKFKKKEKKGKNLFIIKNGKKY